MLLGREGQDIDLVASLSDAELTALGFAKVESTSGAIIYFRYHHEFGKIEITRIATVGDLKEDLLRRDFTVNAMAMDLSGKHHDLLGGEDDLKTGVLRACSLHTFTADPLRLFRAFRFEADGWRMTPECAELIRSQDWSESFSAMPVMRFSLEMLKALKHKTPERFFEQMIGFNIGAKFLPEIFRMPHIPAGPLQHHPEGDLFTHSIQVLQRVAATSYDPLARFCAFFHDIGKLATDPALYPKHHGHDNAGFSLAVDFCNRLCLPFEHRKALAWISSLHGKANKWDELRDSSKIKMAEQAIKAGIVDFLPMIAAADKVGNPPMSAWDTVVRIAGMNTRELGIDQEKLEALSVKDRAAFILQKRVETMRARPLPE